MNNRTVAISLDVGCELATGLYATSRKAAAMPKLTAPLMSIAASGTLGKAIVFSSWKGIPYARQHAVPKNPKTDAQMTTRGTFQWVHDQFKFLPTEVQEVWTLYAKSAAMTAMNAFMQANIGPLRGKDDIADIVFTKPVRSGAPAVDLTLTPGSGTITLTASAPTLITGWSITHFVGVAMEDEAPDHEHEAIISKAGVETEAPYTVTLTGLKHGQKYQCGGFFKYMRPDGSVAYGAAFTGNTTTT